MPLLKQWNPGSHSRAAIWKVEEPESFFLEQTGLSSTINNEKRRIEHLAGRFLLTQLDKEFPLGEIQVDGNGKPYLESREWYFSISHSWPYIAAVIDPVDETGIDIQTWNDKIARIKHKYLSEEEQDMLLHDDKYFTLAWCAKECAYKWHGKEGVEFIEELPIAWFGRNLDINIYFKLNKTPQMIFTKSFMEEGFACTYIDVVQEWAIY